jgi:phosphate transport system substrate-binding protein
MNRTLFGAVLAVGTVALAVVGRAEDPKKAERLNGGGSTFVYPMMEKWSAVYHKAKGIEVNYLSIGSGGGIQQMTAKTCDFGCTDAPLNEEQLKAARDAGGEVVHVPVVLGAVVPAYNLPDVKGPVNFSGPVLADIYLGKITKWNDPALAKINGGVKLPDLEIAVTHRADGSGTSFVFTDYLSKVSPDWKKQVGAGTRVDWPTGTGAKGSTSVAGLVAKTKGGIGYVELTYALSQKDLQFGGVQNQDGKVVRATPASVTAAAASLKDVPDDLRFSLTNAPGKDSYPICGATWVVCYVKQPKDKAKALKDFLTWATHDGQDEAKGLNYARLPKAVVEQCEKKIDLIKGE